MFTKIDELIWKDKDFKKLSVDSRLLFVYLLSCQHRNVLGLYNLPKYYVQGDLGYPIERVSEGLGELSDKGFINYDEGSETVFVKNFLKYNSLDNPNQVKGAAKVFPTIPKTPLFFNLMDRLESSNINQSGNLIKSIKKYIDDNGFERVSKGLPQGLGKQEEVEVEVEVEVEEEVKVEEKENTVGGVDEFLKTISTKLQECGFRISGNTINRIENWKEKYSEEWVVEAINIADSNCKRTFAYVDGILNNWDTNGGMKKQKKREAENNGPNYEEYSELALDLDDI